MKIDISSLQEEAVPERRATNGDVEIAYWVYGEGVPLLLLTGLAMPASTWGPMPSFLAKRGYQAIVMDNRDCGRSTVCETAEYSIADMASDALAVLDDLGIDKTYLVGISMGGFIAQELTLQHPNRVRRLMLMSTGPGIGGGVPPETELIDAIFGDSIPEDPTEASREVIRLLTGPGWAEANPRLVKFAINKRLGEPSDLASMGRHWMASATYSSWDRLDEIKCPVLLIHGESDRMIPVGNGENLAGRIPQCEFVKLPGAGHLVPLERPGELLAAIDRFFPLIPEEAGSA